LRTTDLSWGRNGERGPLSRIVGMEPPTRHPKEKKRKKIMLDIKIPFGAGSLVDKNKKNTGGPKGQGESRRGNGQKRPKALKPCHHQKAGRWEGATQRKGTEVGGVTPG